MKYFTLWTFVALTSGLVVSETQALPQASGIESGFIDVGSNVQLSYTDSGRPSNATSYHTFFAVHGLGFNANVFNKTQTLASQNGFRFVSINRRNYQQSTPYSPEELNPLKNGTDEQSVQFFQDRALELLRFLATYIQEKEIPAFQQDDKSGGVTLLGWSMGVPFSLAAIANADILGEETRTTISSRLRSLIIQQTSADLLGFPNPSQNWLPLSDSNIDPSEQLPFFANWVSSYFVHKDVTSGNVSTLSWVTPSIFRIPTVYNMTQSEYNSMVETVENVSADLIWKGATAPQLLLDTYRKAVYNESIRRLFPNMRVHTFAGLNSPALEPYAQSLLTSDNQKLGKVYGIDTFNIINNVNHFAMWDDPEATLDIYQQYLS